MALLSGFLGNSSSDAWLDEPDYAEFCNVARDVMDAEAGDEEAIGALYRDKGWYTDADLPPAMRKLTEAQRVDHLISLKRKVGAKLAARVRAKVRTGELPPEALGPTHGF